MIARLAVILPLLLAASAHAAPVAVDGRTIELPLPAGYCAVDRDRSPDAQFWEAMRALQEPQTRLLAWFAACEELERWRADRGRGFERYAIVLAPAEPPVASRREYVAEIARGYDQHQGTVTDDSAEMQQRLRERAPDLTPGPLRLQLLEPSADGVLASMEQTYDSPTGPRRVIGVIVYTAANLTRLSANFYGPDTGPEALRPVRDAAFAYLTTLTAANPEPRSSRVWLVALAALAVLVAGGFFWFAKQRRAA
jgi:hypothetical protein